MSVFNNSALETIILIRAFWISSPRSSSQPVPRSSGRYFNWRLQTTGAADSLWVIYYSLAACQWSINWSVGTGDRHSCTWQILMLDTFFFLFSEGGIANNVFFPRTVRRPSYIYLHIRSISQSDLKVSISDPSAQKYSYVWKQSTSVVFIDCNEVWLGN